MCSLVTPPIVYTEDYTQCTQHLERNEHNVLKTTKYQLGLVCHVLVLAKKCFSDETLEFLKSRAV